MFSDFMGSLKSITFQVKLLIFGQLLEYFGLLFISAYGQYDHM